MKAKIILCIGPSCSGKTTWSKGFIKENPEYARVGLDEFRLMTFGTLKANTLDRRFMCVLNNHITQLAMLYKYVVIDGFPLDTDAMGAIIHPAFEIEIKLFDVTNVDSLTRNRKRKQQGGHYLDSNELVRYNRMYKEFAKSDAFKRLTKNKECLTLSAVDFVNVNLELIEEHED